jgi:imidazolonepropionase-like amidohydrolase
MKTDNQYGSVETGKVADVIIVDGDPLVNIRNIRNVSVVVRDGKIYDPGKLQRLVRFTQ